MSSIQEIEKIEKIFSLASFQVMEDEENYYFFRALNNADVEDIESGTTSSNGRILRIRTDRERYTGEYIKYEPDDPLTLEQLIDHIKMHQRKDTNCISLTSNANVAIDYGRRNYSDRYALITVPKSEIGTRVFQAGSYIMAEIEKRIAEIRNTLDEKDQEYIKYYFTRINTVPTIDKDLALIKLKSIRADLPKTHMVETNFDDTTQYFLGGLEVTHTQTIDYKALDDEQNIEKQKLILKIDILKKEIIPGLLNSKLIETLGNAFSSLELIHYGEINERKLE